MSLSRDGYISADTRVPARVARELRELCHRTAKKKQDALQYANRRRGYAIFPDDLTAEQWRALLPPDTVRAIKRYLGKDAEVIRAEILVVPAGASAQEAHRDHDLGPRKSVCVALSLRSSVGTLVAAGTHRIDDDDPMLRPTKGNHIVYDTYLYHAGAANKGSQAKTERIFILLRTADLTPPEKGILTRSLGCTATGWKRAVRINDLLL